MNLLPELRLKIAQHAHDMFLHALRRAEFHNIAVQHHKGAKYCVTYSTGRKKWKERKQTFYFACACSQQRTCWSCEAFESCGMRVINAWRREEGLPLLYKVHVIHAPQ